MPKIRSSSKRTMKIPAKFGNTVCELNKKKNDRDSSAVKVGNITKSLEKEVDGLVEKIVEEDDDVEDEIQGGMFGNRCNENNGIREKVIEEFPLIAEVYSSPIPKVKVTNDTDKNSMGKTEHVTVNKSFIQAIKKNNEYKSELELIPTGLEEGREVMVFDEEIVSEGSKKELIVSNGMYLFKFNNEDDLNHVVERGPWMIKLSNVPLEAWSNKRISAIASSIGKPVIMDQTTTEMCNKGVRRIGYARVLVE
ncbi:ATPase, F1/V1/A1 complex, alpha/beta subunit, partial [Tanacetum coccineum]